MLKASISIIGLMFIAAYLQAENPRIEKIIAPFFIFTIFSTLIGGGISHLFSEYIEPRKARKLISDPKLSFLKELGFEFDSKRYLYKGFWKYYYILVNAVVTEDKIELLTITAFIHPVKGQEKALRSLQEDYELRSSEEHFWFVKEIRGFFTWPEKQKFEKQLDQFINDLIDHNIAPEPLDD